MLDTNDRHPNPVSVIFGIIQTALYVDFAWVYWTRQRVKLRNGGVVDADDMRRGWLLSRIFGNKRFAQDADAGDEESAPTYNDHQASSRARGGGGTRGGASRSKWGSRGISVSADEGLLEGDRQGFQDEGVTDVVDPDAKMQDPDELARALDDDSDDDNDLLNDSDDDAPPPPVSKKAHAETRGEPSGVSNGDEWNDD